MPGLNYYQVLGVPPSADPRTIRDAYLALVRRLHPDRVGPAGTARFQEITEAYETLSDPAKRRAYDLVCGHAVPVHRQASEAIHTRPRAEPLVPEPMSVLDEPETVRPSVEEVFERFIRNFVQSVAPKSERLEAFDIGVILTRQEAARGALLPLGVPVLQDCPHCGGLGGTVFPCLYCGERGRVVRDAIVRVEIPRNVRDGAVIEVPLERIGVRNFYLRVHIAVRDRPAVY